MDSGRLNVLLGADSLVGQRSGVGRLTMQIAGGLRGHSQIGRLVLLAGEHAYGPELLDRLEDVASGGRERALWGRLSAVPWAAALRSAWSRRRLDRLARNVGTPVIYHETNVIARPFTAGPTVVAINDLSWRADASFHPSARVAWLERRLPGTIAQATRFVTISEFTAGELVRVLGIPRERIDVVLLAPSPVFHPMTPETAGPTLVKWGLSPGGYVLSVSTREPRKNFDRLLAAHAQLPPALRMRHPLAIAGGSGWGSALAGGEAERAAASGHLRLLGHVPDAVLAALYAQASAFVFPSLYEGFGLPVIEAMAAGAPVVAASTTAVGETAGDAARMVDPLDVDGIAEGLRTVLNDPELAAELRARGLARAAAFTWERSIGALIASWRRALAG